MTVIRRLQAVDCRALARWLTGRGSTNRTEPTAPHDHRTPNTGAQRATGAMRTSVTTHDSRQRERLALLADQARIHARNGQEATHVIQVVQAVLDGQIAVRDAHECLAELRRQQQKAA